MVFTNQFFYETFMAIVTIDDRLTDVFNQFFLSGKCPEEVESNKIMDTYLNDILLKVRLFIFYLKPLFDSPFSYELN